MYKNNLLKQFSYQTLYKLTFIPRISFCSLRRSVAAVSCGGFSLCEAVSRLHYVFVWEYEKFLIQNSYFITNSNIVISLM